VKASLGPLGVNEVTVEVTVKSLAALAGAAPNANTKAMAVLMVRIDLKFLFTTIPLHMESIKLINSIKSPYTVNRVANTRLMKCSGSALQNRNTITRKGWLSLLINQGFQLSPKLKVLFRFGILWS
jgi:hypothetical protein